MKLSTKLSSLLFALFLISCGDNTRTSPLADISSINLNDSNISLYSTDADKSYTATVNYTDGTTVDGTKDITWSATDTDMLFASAGLLTPLQNGGSTTLKIEYGSKFSDTSALHIKKLESLTYIDETDINISNVGAIQTLTIKGNFENNESNVSLANNITWSGDENITINEQNASSVTFTIDKNVTSMFIKASLFVNTANQVDFNKTFNK